MKTIQPLALVFSFILAVTFAAYGQDKPDAKSDESSKKMQPVYVFKIEHSDKEAVFQTTDNFSLSEISDTWVSKLSVLKDPTSVSRYNTTVANGVVMIVIKKKYEKDLPQIVKDRLKA